MNISNTFTASLPKDKTKENYTRQVHNACYSFVLPTPAPNPKLIHINKKLQEQLGLENLAEKEITEFLSGNTILNDSNPFAMCYGGHQFGHWAGQLGDGRAINIAEINHNKLKTAIQLKGSGPTPYSRGADGYAVLRSSIREYLCSEAMYHLGIPTTRALSLSLSGKPIVRDVLYNGNPAEEPGAIVARTAESFVRFGSFELLAARQDKETLKKLVDFTIKEHYSELGEPSKETYIAFFQSVVSKTKIMIIHWQRVGFVHGVMNTDNMSILGLTIDYGPYGWLEEFNPSWTPNTTDSQHKRYRFGNQYPIALWNLTQLANALYPLIEEVDILKDILRGFKSNFNRDYIVMMLQKVGISVPQNEDGRLIEKLQQLLEKSQVDMTLFFRNLNLFETENIEKHIKKIKDDSYLDPKDFEANKLEWEAWLKEYAIRIESIENEKRIELINNTNPKYVLRNYMAQLAIKAAEKEDYSVLNELFEILKKPYDEQPEHGKWFAKRPKWADDKVGCSMLSCSS